MLIQLFFILISFNYFSSQTKCVDTENLKKAN